MCSSDSTIAPQQKPSGITNHCETTATAGSYHNGATNKHPLPTVLHNTTHDNQHHRSSSEVVEVGRDDESSNGDGPKQPFRVMRLYPFLYKVKASIVIENLNNGHCGQ